MAQGRSRIRRAAPPTWAAAATDGGHAGNGERARERADGRGRAQHLRQWLSKYVASRQLGHAMAEGLLLPHAVSAARVPLSTYRLQFHRGFTFRDARAIANSNPWWFDVLENGPSSRFARFFDVDWYPVKDELAEKLLIPILGDQYGAVLEAQELQLDYLSPRCVLRPLPRSHAADRARYLCRGIRRHDRPVARRPRRAGRRRAAERAHRQPQPAGAQRSRARADRRPRA